MGERPDAVFGALSDATRRAVVARLADGPATPTDLAEHLPVSRQAVSKHLEVLREAGLVRSDRAGREHRYTLVTAPLASAVSWITDVGDRWDERLDALRRQLSSPTPDPPDA
ncbi:MAG: ArsR/SmtB family transcription factor [Acidimicrobiales bacterium]